LDRCATTVAEIDPTAPGIMIAGHFGFAAMVKAREHNTPLWLLMLAAVWLDIVFVPLFLAGIETIRPVSNRGGYGAVIIYADYSHSLVGMLALSCLLAAICLPFWGRRSAIVIGSVAASHWMLDLLVHRADMPLLPADALQPPRLGFGLWRFPVVSAALESGLILAGAWVYWRAARDACAKDSRSTTLAAVAAVSIVVSDALTLSLDITS